MQADYSGTLVRVFYCANNFLTGRMITDDGEEVRFKANGFAEEGDRITIEGEWVNDKKWGRQVHAKSVKVSMDETPDGIAYLMANDDSFAGIGEVRAKRIVAAAFELAGDEPIAVPLRTKVREIADAANVPLEIVDNAAKQWLARRSDYEAISQLCGQGWTTGQSKAIVEHLGDNAAAVVKARPYKLIGAIPRFGFKTVDTVARQLGIPATDPDRLFFGILYCLDREANNGHTWVLREGLLSVAMKELRPDTIEGEQAVCAALESLIEQGLVYVDSSPHGPEVVADARTAATEIFVFDRLLEGLGAEPTTPVDYEGPDATKARETLTDGQAKAVYGFGAQRFSIISGGAGVGKTYTVNAICTIAAENGMKVRLCAPTGKAARRMEDATKRTAQTIHRLLGYTYNEHTGTFTPTFFEGEPLKADLVVVDEVSMVDVNLMAALLRALPAHAHLLLVGDHHQIPSVGPGAILRDILSVKERFSKGIHVLTEVVRQAGVLARNTCSILDGVVCFEDSPTWGIERTEKGHDLGGVGQAADLVDFFTLSPNPVEPFERHLDPAWDIQVLAPMKKGPLGVNQLNVELQKRRQMSLGLGIPEAVKPNDPPKPMQGDRVIWTKNDGELGLFNGTQAIVKSIEKNGTMFLTTEDGEEKEISVGKRKHVQVAYAMTIHKAQGSEWPCVILAAATSHRVMHDRNLLYTGASRASESLTILGDSHGIRMFAGQRRSSMRQTFGAFLVNGWRPRVEPGGADEELRSDLRLV